MSICPICGLEGIPPEKTQCPQCDADLTCFKVLDSLPDELPKEKKLPAGAPVLVVSLGLAAVFLAALIGALVHRLTRVEAQLQNQKTELVESLRSIDARLEQLVIDQSNPRESTNAPLSDSTGEAPKEIPEESLPALSDSKPSQERPETDRVLADQSDHSVAQKEATSEFWTYHSSKKDTLWSLSKRYYGSGRFYPVLLEHNPNLRHLSLEKGASLRILKDISRAKDIYGRIVKWEGNRLYWYYTVSEGDTLESIASKFSRRDERMKRLTRLYASVRLQAGQRIRIPLE